MKKERILRYSILLAMLKTVFQKKLVSEEEYMIVKKAIMTKYQVPFVDKDD